MAASILHWVDLLLNTSLNALQSLFCIAASILNWVDLLQPERIAISFSVLSDGLHTLIHRHLCPHPWTRQTKLVQAKVVQAKLLTQSMLSR